MKLSNYSLNYAGLIAKGKIDIFGFLALCRGLGLEGASLHIRDLPGTQPEVLAKVRRACLDHGLSIAMVTVSTNFGQPEPKQAGELAQARDAIRVASFLGAPLLRVFAGSAPQGDDRQAAWARSVAAVRKVCEEAAQAGLPIGLQNHNHGALCATGADVLRFQKDVDHPNFTIVLDCGQFLGSPGASGARAEAARARPDELYESIRMVAPLARHVRVKFYQPRPDGSEPGIDYDQVLDILRAVHYPGFLDIVYEPDPRLGEDVQTALPRVVTFLRGRLRSGEATPQAASSIRYAGLDNDRFFTDATVRTETDVAFLEGPTVDRAGVVYFTNVKAEQILTWDPAHKRLATFRERSGQANGLIFDREGRLVACEGTGRVTRTDVATGQVSVLADQYQGHPLGAPNDLDIDGKGRIYFTSRLSNQDPQAGNVNAVYRIDPDGSLTRILAAPEIDMPNGIAIAPGDSILYLIDADGRAGRARRIRAYDLKPDGTLANERLLYDFAPGRSGDGMSLDADGNLYVAAGLHRRRGNSETLDTRPGIHVISPQGKLLAFVESPEDTITNCAFGGPDRRTLYITCGKLLLSLRTRIPGKLV
ncbi:MAG TPA: SMP-30/gluconolactonase/LRE family protein [Isosphaeraceae bacterium]|jgi:gluconolactonase|nr:SMP-30/gluconolactonase/LRE family protein [Isosphaeraceae bacterium]